MNNFWPWPFNKWLSTPLVKGERVIALPDVCRAVHCAYFGGTGVGKTTHLIGLMLIDILRRLMGLSERGWIFFDIAGDASDELLSRLAVLPERFRERLAELLVIVDPTIQGWTVGIN